jgi:hypothetical protein
MEEYSLKLKVLALNSRLHAMEICFLKLHPEMQKELETIFMKEMTEGIKVLKKNYPIECGLDQELRNHKEEATTKILNKDINLFDCLA